MMRWLVGTSLRSRGLVVALAAGVMLFGIAQLRDMPRDVLPEFSPTMVEVQTEALGLSAEEVEELITAPLEQDLLNGVAFLDTIRSESVPGLSRIEMVFDRGTELIQARQVVSERLSQAHALPNVSKPPQMLQPVSSANRVMMIGLSSKDKSLIDMSVLARWTIRPALMGTPGVANVSIWGQREHQLQVQVDPARLHAQGVTLDQVIRTTGNSLWVSPLSFLEASTPGTGGFYDTQTQRLGVQHSQPIKTAGDLSRVILDESSTAPAASTEPEPATSSSSATAAAAPPKHRLGEVTTVVEDHQPLIGDAVFTDGPGLLLVVEKFPEANALEVTEDLEETLDSLGPGLSGVEVDSSLFLPARYIEASGDNLRLALIIGVVLLILALGALLWDVRRVLVCVVAVLLSLTSAVVILHFRGETLNAMVLAGLVLALVVLIDDAVVSTSRSPIATGDDSPLHRLSAAVLSARGPLLYATVIVLLALAPVLVLTGEMGAFLPPLALSYAGAVAASLVIALTVSPALRALLRVDAGRAADPPVTRWLRSHHDRLFPRFVRTPRPAYFALGALLVVGLATIPFLNRQTSLVPEFKDRDLLIAWDGAPGTSLPEMRRIAARAGQELRALPGVNNIGGHVGRAVLGDQAVGTNSSELWISIDGSANYDETVGSIEEVVNGYPGIERSVLTYPRERINQILTEPDGVAGKDLTVRVFGQNLDTLRTQADEVSKAMAEVDGVEAPLLELPVLEPTLEVEVNLDRAQALGVKPGDVRRAAATVFSGIEVGSLFEEQKIFEVVVWGTPETRNSVEDVRRLLIDRPDGGGQVRLDEVADVRVTPKPNVIRHEDVSRYIDIGVDVSGRSANDVAGDIRARVRAIQFPLEYHAELLGDYKAEQSSRWTFAAILFAAALGIFLIIQAALGSWRMASVGLVALAAALPGGVVAVLLDGNTISIGSIAGFIGLFGLAARQCVLFIRRSQQLEDRERREFGSGVVVTTAREQLAPTVVTALVTGAVFLPLLVLSGRAGMEVVGPMAAVVIGGLITTTLVSLFVMPALYLRFGGRPEGTRDDLDFDFHLAPAQEEQGRVPATTHS